VTRAPSPSPASDDLLRLTRWEGAGGIWEVVSRNAARATISLCRCDGGEEVDRFTTTDPAALDHVAGRTRSDD
jgi:hypothetical protein